MKEFVTYGHLSTRKVCEYVTCVWLGRWTTRVSRSEFLEIPTILRVCSVLSPVRDYIFLIGHGDVSG